ncbi:hypothetical protein [Acidisoma silvae]|uniref:Uncharacterized protein n=1 Tax=Acidisoma silvae TaxID=2802396 RepID=A0A963YUM0_9PROT|nr:hypothetical protein [Acidisoma silvae]MCB8877333.1 hypothetical protein [Acidisoma silvae]
MADRGTLRWQNKSIAPSNDLRGVLMMGLPVAAFWFVWQWLALGGAASQLDRMPPLLAFAVDKARFMPDFALIIAGVAAFHFQRVLKEEWNRAIAQRLYLRLLTPLVALFLVSLVLFEAVELIGPAHHLIAPWADPLIGPAFWIMATGVVLLVLLPPLLCWTWTAIPDVCWAGVVICLVLTGLGYQEGFHHYLWLWPFNSLVAFALGVFICASLFRAVEYLASVRGPAMILGWIALLAGSILAGPGLFLIGFVMVMSGTALGERSWYLVGERGLLVWSRTMPVFMLVQPAVLTAWAAWAPAGIASGWLGALLAAMICQILAFGLYSLVIPPSRRFFAPPAAPATAG